MNMFLVPVGQVYTALTALMPYLEESAEWTKGRAGVDDLVRFVVSGQMQLWVVVDEDEILGHTITEIKQYPQCKMLVIQYCAMQTGTLEQIEDHMQNLATRFAKDAGCDGIEFIGRPGWRNTANKYRYTTQSVTYQKFFKDEL
jgi:hypothetical protein